MRTTQRSWLTVTHVLLVSTLVLGACSPSGAAYTALTTDHPIAQLADGLTISASPAALTQDFRLQLTAFSPSGPLPSTAQAALAAKPAALVLNSALFWLETEGSAPAQLFVAILAPTAAKASALDMYAWDGQAWSFLPSQPKGGQRVATVAHLPKAVALFQAAPPSPAEMARVEPGDSVPAATPLRMLLLGGVTVQADGKLGGVLPSLPTGYTGELYPVVSADLAQDNQFLTDPAARAAHAQLLAQFALSGHYAGLALEYRHLPEAQKDAFTDFVAQLHTQLRAQNQGLLVYLNLPASLTAPLGGYDWRALGANVEAVLVTLPVDPAVLGSGAAAAALDWATGEVERSRLRLATSALSVAGDSAGFALMAPAEALATLGTAQAAASQITAGQPVTFTLSGSGQQLAFDSAAAAPRYTYQTNGQAHTLWLTTRAQLRQRLALAEAAQLGGVVVADLFRPGLPSDLVSALQDYQAHAAANAASTVHLLWSVQQSGGPVAEATAQPGEAYVFVPQTAGDYRASAQLRLGDQTTDLGSAPVQVAAVPPTATPAPTRRPGAGTGSGSSGGTNSGSNSGSGGSSGGFVPPAPITSGTFELGGQVPGFIAHPTLMKQAKMTWVKIQVRSGGGDAIAAAKSNGFKILISAVGDKTRATDPAYWAEFAQWMGGLAAQGADAIEVWNEPNIDAEWPKGQISGATYAQLLAKAYAAIKAANPGTLVISAAPAPTGAEAAFPGSVMNDDNFLRQMADAGAANSMDCVGIHFNTGTTSPSASTGSALSGYHYSFYFWPMVDLYYNAFGGSRPLCFTELGYLTSEGYGPLPGNFAWAGGITLAQQAQWLAESASLAAGSGKVRLMMIWNVDFTQYAGDPQAGYAMIRPGGACPACSALGAIMP